MTRDAASDIIRDMTERRLTLGIAESLTGGALSAELVRPAGASAVLLGSIVAYATPLKERLLKVDAELLSREGPVHPDVAVQMAEGVRSAVAVEDVPADYGMATTGVAGPDGQGGQQPGTVFVAATGPRGSLVRGYLFTGDRDAVRRSSVEAALGLLTELLGNPVSGE